MDAFFLIAPSTRLRGPKLLQIKEWMEKHELHVLEIHFIPQSFNPFRTLMKAQYFPGTVAFERLRRFYDRKLELEIIENHDRLRKFWPFPTGPLFIFKNSRACGTPAAHRMRVSLTDTCQINEIAQGFYNAELICKVYMVFDEVVAVTCNKCLLHCAGEFAYDSQLDKHLIWGDPVSFDADAVRDIAGAVYNCFQADLIAFDAVYVDKALFVVDINYFTHDSLRPDAWLPRWLHRVSANVE